MITSGHILTSGQVAYIREWVRGIASQVRHSPETRALLVEVFARVEQLALCIKALMAIRDAARTVLIYVPSSSDPKADAALRQLRSVLEMYVEQGRPDVKAEALLSSIKITHVPPPRRAEGANEARTQVSA